MTHVVFRADASSIIGSGHVMRCVTLAGALRANGASSSFICRDHDGNLCDLIERNGYPVSRLPLRRPPASHDSPTSEWLGATAAEDAGDVVEIVRAKGETPDWLVADHYAIGAEWESAVRASVGRMLVIDDLADRVHECDLLLDQNLVANFRSRYSGKVPENCVTLLGPTYALLQPAYAELHKEVIPRKGTIRRILVSFGGADTGNLTRTAIDAIVAAGGPDLGVDVVGAGNPAELASLEALAATRPAVTVHTQLPSLAPLMVEADLAIGGSGATNWERLCLGLPALVVTLAANQAPIADELSRRGLAKHLGGKDEIDRSTFATALEPLLRNGLDEQWSLRCLAEVDGMGAARVCAVMTTTAASRLRARRARPADESLVLEWANDPGTRRNAFSTGQISEETHRKWFGGRLGDGDRCRFYIVETGDGIPIGQVRFEKVGEEWEIHYLLGPAFRGRGLGRPLLDEAIRAHRASDGNGVIFGRVKHDNQASRKVFESLGFKVAGEKEGVLTYRSGPAATSRK